MNAYNAGKNETPAAGTTPDTNVYNGMTDTHIDQIVNALSSQNMMNNMATRIGANQNHVTTFLNNSTWRAPDNVTTVLTNATKGSAFDNAVKNVPEALNACV